MYITLIPKEWKLSKNWEKQIKFLRDRLKEENLNIEERKAIKNYTKVFKEPLFFKHDIETYKTGRVYAKYVLLPNKAINGIYLKKLFVPRKDYVFVSFDFTTSQIRHMASYLDLEWLKEIFNQDIDVYQKYANETGINKRSIAKIIMLTLSFGGNENTIRNKFEDELDEKTIKKAVEIYDEWFKMKNKTYKQRVEFNHIIQRREVEFFKKKLIKLYQKQNKKFYLHAFIHDDVICEVHKDHLDHIENIKKFLEKNKDVKMKVKVSISDTFQFKS